MNRYEVLQKIGDGTYGTVHMATYRETNEKVAIKEMKKRFHSFEEVIQLREIQSLRKLSHENVVKLKEVIRENERLCLVFEYMDANLFHVMKDRHPSHFELYEVRSIIEQTLKGLSFMHEQGFFHRDIKPENLLMRGSLLKIADFGLAREIRSSPPYTDYVSTRWYRAPEILLRADYYNSPIDIFAVGCILAELLSLKPLFPGTNEIDQLHKIFSVLGAPTSDRWSEGVSLASKINLELNDESTVTAVDLKNHLERIAGKSVSMSVAKLLADMLELDPKKRPSAQQALKSHFFQDKIPQSPADATVENKRLFSTPKSCKSNESRKFTNISDSSVGEYSICSKPFKAMIEPSSLGSTSSSKEYITKSNAKSQRKGIDKFASPRSRQVNPTTSQCNVNEPVNSMVTTRNLFPLHQHLSSSRFQSKSIESNEFQMLYDHHQEICSKNQFAHFKRNEIVGGIGRRAFQSNIQSEHERVPQNSRCIELEARELFDF